MYKLLKELNRTATILLQGDSDSQPGFASFVVTKGGAFAYDYTHSVCKNALFISIDLSRTFTIYAY
jgi:hypothetical protein